MNESLENLIAQHVYCWDCTFFRIDDEERPYCYHENECNIGNCDDSMALYCRPCYAQRVEKQKMLLACLTARLRAIDNLAVGFHEGGPYQDGEELDFTLKVQRIADIQYLWEV